MDMVTVDLPARAQTFELATPIIERPNVFDAVVSRTGLSSAADEPILECPQRAAGGRGAMPGRR